MRLAAHARALGLPVKRSLSHFRFFLRFFENEQPIFYNMICTQITLHGSNQHIVAVLAIYRCSTMAQTGVSGPVVVDGESFLDALFASAGQG